MQVSARLLQTHIERTTGKLVTSHHKIKARTQASANDDWKVTVKVLGVVVERDLSASYDVIIQSDKRAGDADSAKQHNKEEPGTTP